MPRLPKPPGTTMPETWLSHAAAPSLLDVFGAYPIDIYVAVELESGVPECLAHGEVRVGQVGVFTDDGDGERGVELGHARNHAAPVVEAGGFLSHGRLRLVAEQQFRFRWFVESRLSVILRGSGRGGWLEAQRVHQQVSQAGAFEDEGNLVDILDCFQRDDGLLGHVAEEGYLLSDAPGDVAVRAADDGVRLDADGA